MCIVKNPLSSFPQMKNIQAQSPLDLVHVHLYGKMSSFALGGFFYLLLLINNFSRDVWVHLLQEKAKNFQRSKMWHKSVETKIKKKVSKFCTNQGQKIL